MAQALRVGETDVRAFFTDGRYVSFLLERRIAHEVVKGRLAPSAGASFDLIDPDGRKWEVRSISKGGIYFSPSSMVGTQRNFDASGFLRKLDEIEGYILSDLEGFPDMPFWILPKQIVAEWWHTGRLGTATKISRKKALALLADWMP